jgi:hypothetical protein
MTSVNVKDLNRMIEAKKLDRNVAFNKVYDMCQQRIISHAKKDKMRTVFEMPEFILGIPPFNLNDALTHVIERLKNNGFMVMYFFPKLLYISWDIDEINGKKVIQPVAMLPGHHVPLRLASSPTTPQSPQLPLRDASTAMTTTMTPVNRSTTPLLPPPAVASSLPSRNHHVPQYSTQHYSQQYSQQYAQQHKPYIPPHMPALDLPMPISSSRKQPNLQTTKSTNNQQPTTNNQQQQNSKPANDQNRFFKSISDYKPSGKFVLDLN